jgi:hypothetical protein
MSKDLHEKPFDETTIAKLEIFEDYAQATSTKPASLRGWIMGSDILQKPGSIGRNGTQ